MRVAARRRFMFGPGTLTGATDFILRQPRTFRVTAQEGRVRAVSMHRSEFETLADKDPEVSGRAYYAALCLAPWRTYCHSGLCKTGIGGPPDYALNCSHQVLEVGRLVRADLLPLYIHILCD